MRGGILGSPCAYLILSISSLFICLELCSCQDCPASRASHSALEDEDFFPPNSDNFLSEEEFKERGLYPGWHSELEDLDHIPEEEGGGPPFSLTAIEDEDYIPPELLNATPRTEEEMEQLREYLNDKISATMDPDYVSKWPGSEPVPEMFQASPEPEPVDPTEAEGEGPVNRESFVNEVMEDLVASHYTSSNGFKYTTSPIHLMRLAILDRRINSYLATYADTLRERLGRIESYMRSFDQHRAPEYPGWSEGPEEPDWLWASAVSTNPLSAFQLIQRMSTDLPDLLRNIESGQEIDFMDRVYEAKGDLPWLDPEDTVGAVESILELQAWYRLDVAPLSNGVFTHSKCTNLSTAVSLTAAQCHQIGTQAFNTNKFATAVEWMDAAWRKYYEQDDSTISAQALTNDMNFVIEKHDEELTAYENGNVIQRINYHGDIFSSPVSSLTTFRNARRRNSILLKLPDPKLYTFQSDICMRKNRQDEEEQAALFCNYEHQDPYWRINPLKIEVLKQKPRLVLVHDLVGESSTLELIATAFPIIETVNSYPTGSKAPIPAVIRDKVIPGLRSFSKNLDRLVRGGGVVHEQFSDYDLDHLLVSVHSFGNNDTNDQLPKPDFTQSCPASRRPGPEWKIVVHAYLNEVVAGGLTAFPGLGLTVRPVSGSALVWTTFPEDDDEENEPFVSGCPVVIGNKWTATKYYYRRWCEERSEENSLDVMEQ